MKQLTISAPLTLTECVRPYIPIMLFAIVIALPGLLMGLHADDWFQIKPRSATEVMATFTGDWNSGDRGQGGFYRPLVRLSFYLDRLLYGSASFGYHLTNSLFFLLIVAGSTTLAHLMSNGHRWIVTASVGVALLINPIKSEALYWVSGRTDLLASTFGIWAVCLAALALRSEKVVYTALSMLMLIGALLSKEVALSLCAIIPLIVYTWKPIDGKKSFSRILIITPIILGILYMAGRSLLLGGLAGYEGNYRTVWSFFEGYGRALSGLFAPWQSDGPLDFRLVYTLLSMFVIAAILITTSFRRHVVGCLGAMMLALVPISFVSISPNDGARNLMLATSFLPGFFAAFLTSAPVLRMPVAILAVPMALGMLWDKGMIIEQFLSAETSNRVRIEGAWKQMAELEDGVVFVAPEPPLTEQRRILDPGAAMIMAMLTKWIEVNPNSSIISVADMETPNYSLILQGKRTVTLAEKLQPWMERSTHLQYGSEQRMEVVELKRVGDAESLSNQESPFALNLEENQVGNFALKSTDRIFQPRYTISDNQGNPTVRDAVVFKEGGPSISWIDSLTPLASSVQTITVDIETSGNRIQQLHGTSARFQILDRHELGEK